MSAVSLSSSQASSEGLQIPLEIGQQREVDLSNLEGRRLETLTLENRSPRPVSDVVIREASRDWTSPDAILKTILEDVGSSTDREKTLILFQYLCDNLGQDVYRSNWDCYDVWKAFNCYGAGHCEFHARLFSALLEMAGVLCLEVNLRTTENRGGFGHTQVEVFYDGGWHLFDPHGRVFYLDATNASIAGWAELLNSPSLLKRTRPRGWAFLGVDVEDWTRADTCWWYDDKQSRTAPLEGDPSHLLGLAPGEEIRFDVDGTGTYVDNWSTFGPPKEPQSKVTRFLRFPAPDRTWAAASRRVGFESLGSGALLLEEARQGLLVVDVESPYPIVDATVTLDIRTEGFSPFLQVRGGRTPLQDKEVEGLLEISGPPGKAVWKIALRDVIEGWNRPYVSYAYRLYLEGSTDFGESIQIRGLTLETVSQVARASLPRLEASPWVFAASGQGDLSLRLETSLAPSAPAKPDSLEVIHQPGAERDLELSWEIAGEEPAWVSQVEVSDDPRFRWSLSPGLGIPERTAGRKLRISPTFFPPKGALYWRVRSVGKEGETSEWTNGQAIPFALGEPDPGVSAVRH